MSTRLSTCSHRVAFCVQELQIVRNFSEVSGHFAKRVEETSSDFDWQKSVVFFVGKRLHWNGYSPVRCRANLARTRQSRPESGLCFQVKVL